MVILNGLFVLVLFFGVFSGCCSFFVCLFFFGTSTLALLGKQKWGYIHACSVSYGAKDRNIVRKTVLLQCDMYVVLGCCVDLGQQHSVVSKLFSVQSSPRLSC